MNVIFEGLHIDIDADLIENNDIAKRISKDKVINRTGRSLINICKETDILIVNGRIGADKGVGNFTCKNAL